MNGYDSAVRRLRDARRNALDKGLVQWQQLLAADDELADAYDRYRRCGMALARGKDGASAELEAALSELKTQMSRRDITRDDFVPPCACAVCNDTGVTASGYCKCVIARVINSDKSNHSLPQWDFATAKSSAPTAIAKVYTAAEQYIRAFPKCDKPFFVITGASGTGKTVLASAIATELMARGAATVAVSAFEFLQRAKDYHTQFAIENYIDRFTPMVDCDVLVIDDLGTETMLKNITREYLYNVINERWLHGKSTVVTTNLTPEALLARYGEAIFSRLCDKSRSLGFAINAKNARLAQSPKN